MSGILGIFQRKGEPVDFVSMAPMLHASKHRAVDGEDVWHGDSVILAHQHFRITPEEQNESQPLISDSGRWSITFDGRLDNRRELLARFDTESRQAAGWSESDATLVLAAYIQWEQDCVRFLRGDFAFAVWDRDLQSLFVARDPLGVRQVCYFYDAELFLFASNVESLLAHPAVSGRINERKIANFLVWDYVNQEDTFFENIQFCLPAHTLWITQATIECQRYWQLNVDGTAQNISSIDYAEEFLALLRSAVEARLRCTGRIGVAISGGLDSTSVAALTHEALLSKNRLADTGLHTYSYVFNECAECDERPFISMMTNQYGFNSKYLLADDKPVWMDGQNPFISAQSPSFVGTASLHWFLMEQAREDDCQIILGGTFADALFLGQTRWAQDMIHAGEWGLFVDTIAYMAMSDNVRLHRFVRSTAGSYFRSLFLQRSLRIAKDRLFSMRGILPEFAASMNVFADSDTMLRASLSTFFSMEDHARVLQGGGYVQERPKMTDAANQLQIEEIDPFRDQRVVEYCLQVPGYEQGIPPLRQKKRLLRSAMAHYLPQEVRQKEKNTPFVDWSKVNFWQREWPREKHLLTKDAQIVARGYVDSKWLTKRIEQQEARALP